MTLHHLARIYRAQLSVNLSDSGHGNGRVRSVDRAIVGPDGEHFSPAEIYGRFPRALLIGAAGIGKTTLLEQVALHLADQFIVSPETTPCPVFIRAREIPDIFAERDFFPPMAAHLSAVVGEVIEVDELRRKFGDGSIYLISDALDEVPRFDGVGRLTDLYRQFPKLPGLVASRPIALTANLRDFHLISMVPLELDGVESLVRDRWPHQPRLADDLLGQFATRPELASLLQSPLLTQLCIEVFESLGRLPESRPEIFKSFVEQTIDREFRRLPKPVLSRGQQLAIYSHLAEFLSRNEINHASDVELRAIVESVIGRPPDNNLYERELSAGILLQQAPAETSFAHRSLLEYFQAWHHKDDVSYFVDAIRRGGATTVVEFGAHLVDDAAPLVEAAMNAGMLADAVTYLSAARNRNPALDEYVLQRFRAVLGRSFVAKLATYHHEPEDHVHDTQAHLLDMLDSATDGSKTPYWRGKSFETFCANFFRQLFKVTVQRALLENGEIDLILENSITSPFWAEYGGEFLVECKNLADGAPVSDINEFAGKLLHLRVKLAFVVSVNGFTDFADSVLLSQSSNPRLALIVPISGEQLRNALRTRKDPETFIKDRITEMKFRMKNRSY